MDNFWARETWVPVVKQLISVELKKKISVEFFSHDSSIDIWFLNWKFYSDAY